MDRMVLNGAVISKIVWVISGVNCYSSNGDWLCSPDLDGTIEVVVEKEVIYE
jgi:hypothetical protein